ncbi:hypothetical protein WME98_19145 [Sorangium sp. So ce296]|uniref:hypothetical protein n=1 Tax=Sorangium sp. So ce296 TaxID=3133296 RepID=UPI003F648C02
MSKPVASKTEPRSSTSRKTQGPRTKPPASSRHDPTADGALLALDPNYAAAPDMPVSVAERELTSLARRLRRRSREKAKPIAPVTAPASSPELTAEA